MHIESIAFLAPLVAVMVFFLIEQFLLNDKKEFVGRVKTILTIKCMNIVLGISLSAILLMPIVTLLAPVKIFSLARLDLPSAPRFIINFLFLDFISYAQHRLNHSIPFLWKFHRLHHSDKHVDSMTTFLHHPLEITFGFLITTSLLVIFNVSIYVLTIYIMLLGVHSAFTHFKSTLPQTIDKYLKYIFITPNFHMVHHSRDMKEGNSNFGGLFIFWDILFGTTQNKSPKEVTKIKFGINNKESPDDNSFFSYIKNPFI